MNWAMLIGLLAIALGIFFGLLEFRKGVSSKLLDIRNKLIEMEVTMEKAWYLIKLHFSRETGTVERKLKNLGKTIITASQDVNMTTYLIKVENPVLQEGLIVKLSKETELENKEKEMFDGKLTMVYVSLPNQLTVKVPSADPRICTEYISMFLRWLDSTYFEALKNVKDYEEPIQV